MTTTSSTGNPSLSSSQHQPASGFEQISNMPAQNRARRALIEYVAVCNCAIVANEDRPAFALARHFNRALRGLPDFRTLIYDGDPDNIVGEAQLHFDSEQFLLSVQSDDDRELALTWKVPLHYLEEVADHPAR